MEWIILFGILIILFAVGKAAGNKRRREELLKKYGDEEIVDLIMSRSFWQGQSEEQLIDSLGKPLGIDQKVLKTKTKEIWKYDRTGTNRYGLRITLENGAVVGWDKKD